MPPRELTLARMHSGMRGKGGHTLQAIAEQVKAQYGEGNNQPRAAY